MQLQPTITRWDFPFRACLQQAGTKGVSVDNELYSKSHYQNNEIIRIRQKTVHSFF